MIFIANAPDFGTYVGTCMGSSLLLPNRHRRVFFRAIIMINNGCMYVRTIVYGYCVLCTIESTKGGIFLCIPLNS